MCSVLGCGSWRCGAQRYKLPEDPERRLEWVQFLFEVNGQRLKESSWTDITICRDHFTEDCFEDLTPAGTVLLRAGAAPSLGARAEADEPAESPAQCVEPVEATDATRQHDDRNTSNSPTLNSADAVTSHHNCTQYKVRTTDINEENEGKFVVNESCLLHLFRHKCPSCGCKLRMEKVTSGVLVVLNQQCLQCEYRNQWKSQVDACVPTAGDQAPTGETAVTPEAQAAAPTDDSPGTTTVSEIVTFGAEESDPLDEGEEGVEGEVSSDRECHSTEDVVLAEELKKASEDETDDEGEEEKDFVSPSGLKINELCTECGLFFSIQKPHVCEHKIKPYSCNICGKRCVTEMSLKNHSVIHDETYEHPCKFCHVTFKTRLAKLKHEQIHQDRKDPYRCPDCPKTFPTNRECRVHLANHRTPKEFRCGVCGIAFKDVHHLRRHSVVHTGLKPYKCSVCQRGFNQGSHLKSHMRLHTGERPYKCQNCDKCFNHNVSLKSHVQRYHSASSRRKRKANKGASDSGDADNNRNKEGADSGNVEQDTEEEVQKAKTRVPKSRRRCTGRPKGRPKRKTSGNLSLPGQKEERRSNTKTAKSKKLKKTGSSDEESEDEQSDSDVSLDSAEEEQDEEEEMAKKSKGRPKRRPKNEGRLDFNQKEKMKRKKNSSQNSGKSSGGRRGRPKKNAL